MFCIVTVVRVHVLYCDSDTCTFRIVTLALVHVLYCDSGTRTFFFYCDSGTCTYFVMRLWYVRKKV